MPFLRKWMGLETICEVKIRQIQKDKYCMIFLRCRIGGQGRK
jgi:hypothetical protein